MSVGTVGVRAFVIAETVSVGVLVGAGVIVINYEEIHPDELKR